ncbi:hypothetical protein [Actinobacillus vicugnae]|uniref:hypothetical protein n=1 Tax=Actinobacillus vicugnae TaxID=2573093 RepID=UPI00123F311C|nr:hypothetical protein [Actinobacillus vicugnae]
MNSEILWAFAIVALSLTLSPGADWAYMIAAGIQKRVIPAILGIVVGYVIVVLIVATGLGVTLAKFPALLNRTYHDWRDLFGLFGHSNATKCRKN